MRHEMMATQKTETVEAICEILSLDSIVIKAHPHLLLFETRFEETTKEQVPIFDLSFTHVKFRNWSVRWRKHSKRRWMKLDMNCWNWVFLNRRHSHVCRYLSYCLRRWHHHFSWNLRRLKYCKWRWMQQHVNDRNWNKLNSSWFKCLTELWCHMRR